MKKISMILSFALFSIAFTACKKEESKFCATCKITTTTTTTGNSPARVMEVPGDMDVDVEIEQCDVTQTQLDQMMKEGTTTVTSTDGGITTTTKMVMSCAKK
jgi:Zn-dependent membrane protease YugP